MNIFIGNLAFEAKEADAYQLFMPFGRVTALSLVMDKKGEKSRGFGFLEMPDEQQALAAITALNGKEFMGRVLKIEPARTKVRNDQVNKKRKNIYPDHKAESKKHQREKPAQKSSWFTPVFKRTGRYKEGRRTHSFMKKRIAAGNTEPMPERKNQENPMRWRKNKPWQKKRKESKPWGKTHSKKTYAKKNKKNY